MRIRNREVDVVYSIGVSIIALFVLGVIGVIIPRIAHEISLPDDAHQYRNCKILQNSKYVKCSDLTEYAKTFDRTKIANTLFKENDGKPYLEIEYCGDQVNGHDVCFEYEFIAKTKEEADRVTNMLIDGRTSKG